MTITEPTVSERNETRLAVMSEKVGNIEGDVKEVKGDVKDMITRIENHYVTKAEFAPVKTVVYGLVSLIVVAVIGAVISLVIQK